MTYEERDTRSGIGRWLTLALLFSFSLATYAANPWKWGPIKKDACTAPGMRQYSSRLWNIPGGTNWNYACQNAPRNVMGVDAARPDRCIDLGISGEWGEWDVPDTSCQSGPRPAPVRGGTGTLASSAPLEGYADLHVHQMGHLAFAGTIIWGGAYGDPAAVLGPIPAELKPGHDRVTAAFESNYLGAIFGGAGHGEDGYPSFASWPSRTSPTHQQAYDDWLFRAYAGGLRLIVMLAHNSEDPFGRGENDLPLGLNYAALQDRRLPGRTGNDMEALEWQVREAYRMQALIDQRYGGPGQGWYRIVRDPDEASAAIAQGKLAVVLGTEMQHLFNCDADRPACTEQTVIDGLDQLEALGVNYVFTIHHKLNQFGGPSQFNPLTNGPTEDCIETVEKCSSAGLTALGKFLVRELMARGMLIDTDHLGWKAFADMMDIAEANRYPVLASHAGNFSLAGGDGQHEEHRRADQLRRIFAVGGMVAPMLGTGGEEYAASKTTPTRTPISCGGADVWANNYQFLKDLAGGNGMPGGSSQIALGSDWNGFAAWPAPRYGSTPCQPRTTRDGYAIPKPQPVSYPLQLPAQLVPAAIGGNSSMTAFHWLRTFDYNREGLGNIGLMPEFLEDLRLGGMSVADLEAVYRSARGTVELWRTARNRITPGDRGYLRWVPQNPWVAQSPFDVISEPLAGFADPTRNVSAAGTTAICRTRIGKKLGFEKDAMCVPVETQTAEPGPSEFATASGKCLSAEGDLVQGNCAGGQFQRQFDIVPTGGVWNRLKSVRSGKCLDVASGSGADGAGVVEWDCHDGLNQRWQLRSAAAGQVELVNQNSGKCLTAGNDGSRPVQQACQGLAIQRFTPREPTRLRQVEYAPVVIPIFHNGRCLDVAGWGTADGAKIQEWTCNGKANQRFQLRSNDAVQFEIVDVHSGKCLDVDAASSADGARIKLWTCHGGSNQLFRPWRIGNTFALRAKHSGKCLDIDNATRSDGTIVKQWECNYGSNQLWSVEPLRNSDYAKLYQADKNRIAWLAAANAIYRQPVLSDSGRAICRSADASHWLGVVSNGNCIGKTYALIPATTSSFEHLLQMD